MTTRPEVSIERDDTLPDRLPDRKIEGSLWDLFGYPPQRVDLELKRLEWPEGQDDFEEGIFQHWARTGTASDQGGVGRWRLGSTAALQPVSLWTLIHRAWSGRTPKLIVDISFNMDGQAAMDALLEISYGVIEADIHIVGDSVESVANHNQQTWLDPDEADVVGQDFIDCMTERLYNHNEVDVWGHMILLGEIQDVTTSDSFVEAMAEVSAWFDQLDSDTGSGDDKFQAEINEVAKECAAEAHEAWDLYRKNHWGDEYDDDDDDDDDEWDEDDDSEEWDDEDDEQ